jgi:hypothetical protein
LARRVRDGFVTGPVGAVAARLLERHVRRCERRSAAVHDDAGDRAAARQLDDDFIAGAGVEQLAFLDEVGMPRDELESLARQTVESEASVRIRDRRPRRVRRVRARGGPHSVPGPGPGGGCPDDGRAGDRLTAVRVHHASGENQALLQGDDHAFPHLSLRQVEAADLALRVRGGRRHDRDAARSDLGELERAVRRVEGLRSSASDERAGSRRPPGRGEDVDGLFRFGVLHASADRRRLGKDDRHAVRGRDDALTSLRVPLGADGDLDARSRGPSSIRNRPSASDSAFASAAAVPP